MRQPSAPIKWDGWGEPDRRVRLGPEAVAMLKEELGETDPAERARLEEVVVPPARPLPPGITEIVGPAAVLTSHEHRVRRAAGRGYPDLVRLRAGRLSGAPDAVVVPADGAQIARLLDLCSREGVAAVPFGGGTSVV